MFEASSAYAPECQYDAYRPEARLNILTQNWLLKEDKGATNILGHEPKHSTNSLLP